MPNAVEYSAENFLHLAQLQRRKGIPDPGALRRQGLCRQGADGSTINDADVDCQQSSQPRKPGPAAPQPLEPDEFLEIQRAELQVVEQELHAALGQGTFHWGLATGPNIRGRATYRIYDTPPHYFAMKQLEDSLRRKFNVRPADRHQLVTQVGHALESKLPRHVLKTDIAAYFESIPHTLLLDKLAEADGISLTSRRLIDQLLAEWRVLTGKSAGIPTGVGISTVLSEIYAGQLDQTLRSQPELQFYGRYVDDIVIVARTTDDLRHAESLLRHTLQFLQLSANTHKHFSIELNPHSTDFKRPFEYLGYEIDKSNGAVRFNLASTAISRYRDRIQLAFDRWRCSARTSSHDGLLLHRVQFLTGNTRLHNSKTRALTGIYFNYPLLNSDCNGLKVLDDCLAHHIQAHSSLLSQTAAKRLGKLSFTKGHATRKFYRFPPGELARITAVWR